MADKEDHPTDYFDLSNAKVAWTSMPRSGTGGIYITDIMNGETVRVGRSRTTWEPKISGNLLVWTDWATSDGDIVLYNFATGTERRITDDNVVQLAAAVSGDKVVWQDHKNGNPDIFMLDTASDRVVQLTGERSEQIYPVINGNRIVWQDYRNGEREVYLYAAEPGRPTGVFAENSPEEREAPSDELTMAASFYSSIE